MSDSNRSHTNDNVDSLPREEVVAAALRAIKDLNENPTPRGTELLRNFVRDVDEHVLRNFVRDVDEHLQEERTSTSDENQLRIRKMLVFLSKEIGKGNFGTVIYEGRYEHRPVAVKRLPRSHHIVVDREIEHLIKADQYRNIVRYHAMESDRDFYYLVMERCDCNLDDLIQMYSALYEEDRLQKLQRNLGNVKLWEGVKARPSPLLLKLMGDMVSGLVALHALNIIHRDLKPKSILIIKEISTLLCAKLSDMGFCRTLSGNKSYLTNPTTGWQDTGWKAPEQLLCQQQTRAMDMFSLGCILFFCITQGKHPFGEPDERDRNIKNNKKDLFLIEDFPEAFHLISRLLEVDDPKKRPDANEVLQHPIFWNAAKRISFLHDTSDSAENNKSKLSDALNGTADTVLPPYSKVQNWCKSFYKVNKNWSTEVDDRIMSHMRNYRPYNYCSVQDLLRLIRNMFNHYEELPTDIQELVGSRYEGLDGFFTSKFPMLFIEVYEVVSKGYKAEERLEKYFMENL